MTDIYQYHISPHYESPTLKKLFSVNRNLKNFDGRGDLVLCDTELYRKNGQYI